MYRGDLAKYFIIEPNFEFAKKNYYTYYGILHMGTRIEIN